MNAVKRGVPTAAVILFREAAHSALSASARPKGTASWVRWLAVWTALFAMLTLAVHLRLLVAIDEAAMRFLAMLRVPAFTDAANWIFRLGYVHVDAALALLWAALLLARRRSLLAALPPLVLFVAVGIQGGLRLVIDQPGPDQEYAVRRDFVSQPVGYVLDGVDFAARESFVAAVPGRIPQTPSSGQASFPSGHAARGLFLVLLAVHELQLWGPVRSWPWLGRSLLLVAPFIIAGLIGYSAMYFGYHWPSDVLGGYLLALSTYPVAAGLSTSRRRDSGHNWPEWVGEEHGSQAD